MNKCLLFVLALALAGCVSAPQQRPQAVVLGQRYLELGVQAYQNDNYANAAALFTKALAHYRGLDDRQGMFRSRLDLGETALAVGNFAAAQEHVDVAAALAKAEGWKDALRRTLLLRSSIALKEQHYDVAEAAMAPLLVAGAPQDDIWRYALANRAALELARNGADASQWIARYVKVVHGGAPADVARGLRLRAELRGRAGDPAEAERLFEQALALYKTVPSRSGIAATLEQWAMLLMNNGHWREAQDRLQRALNVRLWLLDRSGSAADLRRLEQVAEAQGNAKLAAALHRWAELVGAQGPLNWSDLRREVLPY